MEDKTTQQKKKLTLREGKSTFKMLIPSDVEAKIRHICGIIHDVEWSGVLFYTYSGSMDDGSFSIICKDIYVMDIGSGGYTEYDENPSILDYRIQNNLLDESVQEGLIHSHNNMSTFFSGTDNNTLLEEGTNSNHFVSLIVNNAGLYTARVTRKITRDLKATAHIIYEGSEYYDSYGGNKIIIHENKKWEEDKEETKTIQEVEWFNLDITKQEANSPFTDIDARLREIKRSKDVAKSNKSYPYLNTYNKSKYSKEPKKWEQSNIFPGSIYDPLARNYDGYDDYDDYYDYRYSHQHDNITYDEYKKIKKNEEEEEFEETPLCLTEFATKSVIKDLSAQLLTGDITINPDKFNEKQFVSTMDYTFEKKFGPLISSHFPNISSEVIDNNNKKLDDYIDSMVDYVVYSEDKELIKTLNKKYDRNFTEIDTAEIIAMDLWRYLNDLPDSYVKDKIMDTLLNYLPYGAIEYFGN